MKIYTDVQREREREQNIKNKKTEVTSTLLSSVSEISNLLFRSTELQTSYLKLYKKNGFN